MAWGKAENPLSIFHTAAILRFEVPILSFEVQSVRLSSTCIADKIDEDDQEVLLGMSDPVTAGQDPAVAPLAKDPRPPPTHNQWEDIKQIPSHWKPTSDMLDYNTVYGMPLPRRVVSTSASRSLGIDNLPVHEIRLIQVLQDSSYDWCLRQVAAGKTCYLEMFRSRQEAFFSTALHRHLRDSRIDFSQVLQGVAATHNMPCDLTVWENRKMGSAKLTQVVGDYMISLLVGTNMTEHLTERLRNLEQENAQLRASQVNPTQRDLQESPQDAEGPYEGPPGEEAGTMTPCRVPSCQVHLRSPLRSGLHHKPALPTKR